MEAGTLAKPTKCPGCGRPFSRIVAGDGSSETPRPGDYSVCMACAAVLCFDDGLRLRAATDDERDAAPPDVWAAALAISSAGKQGRA